MTAVAAPALGTPGQRKALGTFAGVFTPGILTILGIVLFLRLGYVVGGFDEQRLPGLAHAGRLRTSDLARFPWRLPCGVV